MDEKKLSALDKIDILSKKIGLKEDKEKTILNIEDTDEKDKKLLVLKSGDWDGDEPWFAIDKDDKIHTIISLDTLLQIVKSLRKAQEENFNLKLEKTIWQNVPIDFQDVWIVAMDEIKKRLKNSEEKNSVNINIEKVVEDIKKKYPNLFLNMDRILSQKFPQELL